MAFMVFLLRALCAPIFVRSALSLLLSLRFLRALCVCALDFLRVLSFSAWSRATHAAFTAQNFVATTFWFALISIMNAPKNPSPRRKKSVVKASYSLMA
jgi:hypothetical protein